MFLGEIRKKTSMHTGFAIFFLKGDQQLELFVHSIDLRNIVKATISSPTLSQGVSRICQ